MKVIINDGGRAAAGYKGSAGDCVVRAIAIATEQPYQTVYDALYALNQNQKGKLRGASPRDGGTKTATIRKYMAALGWKWTPTMFIGSGCKVHLTDGELPMGRLVVNVSKHLCAVIDGVIHDTYDPQRATLVVENGVSRIAQRCVYGYYSKA